LHKWVNLVTGTPSLGDFQSTAGGGSPVCIDITTGFLYYLSQANVITPLNYLGFAENFVSWPPNGVRFLPEFHSYTFGDERVQGTTTIFAEGFEFDLSTGAGSSGPFGLPSPGGCYFNVILNAHNRVPFGVYGTVLGWEYNATPYVNTDPLMVQNVQTKITGYTEAALTGLQVRICNLAAGFTVSLPTAVGNTGRFTFIKALAAGVITIDGNGTETINGALTTTLNAQYDKVTIVSDNANWWIV
jgi:hypothetical protein